jgi:hypothetical protein
VNRRRIIRGALLVVPVLALLTLAFSSVPSDGASSPVPGRVALKVSGPTTVMFAVHHGSYATAYLTFRKLIDLRNSEGIKPSADWATLVFLNRPAPGEDPLIEVRIPVEAKALQLKATLRERASLYDLGIADVKQIGDSAEIRIAKPIGSDDPTPFFNRIFTYIQDHDLTPNGPPSMIFSKSEEIPAECDAEEINATVAASVKADSAFRELQSNGRDNRRGQ